jgi:cation diffusion facilitator CzcD-associated flavoprotein CzcO
VDSDSPLYQLFDKEIWQDFTFKERYPSWQELRRYFDFLDEKLKFSEHTVYNCAVTGARFDESRHRWLLTCSDGTQTYCRWFIAAIGFAAKIYVPPFKGLDKFKGEMHHTAVRSSLSSIDTG